MCCGRRDSAAFGVRLTAQPADQSGGIVIMFWRGQDIAYVSGGVRMSRIKIQRVGEFYSVVAVANGRSGRASSFSGNAPMTKRQVIDSLLECGWHQQDIGDAFYDADPDWVDR